MDKILLIDGANQIWRANMSWGKNKSEDEKSKYVIIYNFFRNLRATVEQFSPNKIFFILEGRPKHRYEIYGEYKANRIIKTAEKQEQQNKFYQDQNLIINLLKFLPITCCKAEHYECDDVIATLADNMSQENITVISNDSDYIQLLQRGYSKIQIFNPIKKQYMENPKYPYVAWKSLRGDKSDNIPSLMSDLKAEKLILNPNLFSQWMSIEENRANFSINKKLIEFAHVPLDDIIIEEGQRNFKLLRQAFTDMEFKTLLEEKAWEKFCKTFMSINI